jgi:hypothetical protein
MDPLLGNDSINTFPRKRTLTTIRFLLLGYESVTKPSQQWGGCVFYVVRAEGL